MDVNDIGIAILQALFAGLPFGAALALAILLSFAMLALSSATGRLTQTTRALVVVGAVIVGSTLSVAFSGRTLYSDAELLRNPTLAFISQSQSAIGIQISQVCTLISLLFSFSEIMRCITTRVDIFSPVAKLWWSFFLFNCISVGLAGVVGVFREPDFKYLYFIVLFSGLAAIAPKIDAGFWRGLRWLLTLPSIGSLVWMAFAPQVVLLNDYEAFIPGLKSRLFGLAEHANGIGILAAVALTIEFSTLVRRKPSLLLSLIHIAVLILSQSKTAWLAVFVVLAVVRWNWITSANSAADPWRRRAWMLVAAIGLLVATTIVLALASTSVSLNRTLEAKSVFTLTGRFRIWELTIVEFLNSPWFGYGPSLWDLQFRMERNLPFAGQAHNQIVQILGQAGLFGLISMLVYLITLGRLAFRARKFDHGLTLALFVLILFRCIVESPLRMSGIMGWENLLHLIVLVGAASSASRCNVERRESAPFASVFYASGNHSTFASKT